MRIKGKKNKEQKPTGRGKAVRLSLAVTLEIERRKEGAETPDSVLRRLLGLPPKRAWRPSKKPSYLTYFVIKRPELAIFESMSEARGAALLRSRGSELKPERPRKVVLVE